ncbi:acyltransferase family protein [Flavobacterium sp. 245]|uniref:acyltransferase family protein n=1 Tax=Flavobacterium sp. 245 TaxID=2512115 RepID=UPI00105D3A41|nr:acyltransferase [Flavobacterium sp. 245]TDP00868.1 peptidoglycan/LPS O-acetylase OafA/YrhL [Flavobacterium sp. 245]
MKNNRIEILDSFRGIAIVMVIFFHFFSRWTNLYPYYNKYDYFGYGKYGVHFFFMISGFVILFTLERTKSLGQFWSNRFTRLLPGMFFASVLTYIFFNFLDNDFLFPASHYFKNIVVSLTFIQPDLLSSLTRYTVKLDYISASYWSLWVEIQFYVLASFLYFFCKKSFYRNFFTISIILSVFSFVLSYVDTSNSLYVKLKAWESVFNLGEALPFFCLGAVFYVFYENNLKQIKNVALEKCLFLFFSFFLLFKSFPDLKKMSLFIVFISLFLLMIYYPRRISFLNAKVINSIGVSSYFLYLIHENIGIFLINKNHLNFNFLPFLPTLIYIMILIVSSVLFTKYVEGRIIMVLKKVNKF